MWVVINKGFVSIVANGNDPSGATLLVRARRKRDLLGFFQCTAEKLGEYLKHDVSRDYHYRVVAKRDFVGKMVARHAANIDYTNFKDSIKDDADLHQMATETWVVGFRNLDERAIEFYNALAKPVKKEAKNKATSGKKKTVA